MSPYPKILAVTPLTGRRLRVQFENGEHKTYDCKPLLSEAVFAPLQDEAFFRQVHVDGAGYGVSWNEEVDLSEAELWLQGVEEEV